MEADPRTGVVLITWNRREEAFAAAARALDLPGRRPVVAVDNGSGDGTAAALRSAFADRPRLEVIALRRNLGAVGCNTLWFTWPRRPRRAAAAPHARAGAHGAARRGEPRGGLGRAPRRPVGVMRERRVLPAHAEARFAALEESQARSVARRYVG